MSIFLLILGGLFGIWWAISSALYLGVGYTGKWDWWFGFSSGVSWIIATGLCLWGGLTL